jgi:hypothetical protein
LPSAVKLAHPNLVFYASIISVLKAAVWFSCRQCR